MNYKVIQKLPTLKKILAQYPLSKEAKLKIARDRLELKNILKAEDKRLIIIVGPCSAWPQEAVITYAKKLQELNTSLNKKLKIIMRMYIQKSRTTKGWTGAITQPDPFKPPDLEAGLYYARKMMLEVINIGLPLADECLFTHNSSHFEDLVSWFAIGARSSENHEHRICASKATCPVGLKNPTHGSLEIAVNSVIAAQIPHIGILNGQVIQSFGNKYAHLVLRGSDKKPNYSNEHLELVEKYMLDHNIENPSVIIDASHDNTYVNNKKDPLQQVNVILNTLENIKSYPRLKKLVKGFMIESYLKTGSQKLENCNADTIDFNGLSITDPCLGWEETENLLKAIYDRL